MLDGTFTLRPHNFANRPGITLPVAGFFAVFGRGLWVKVLWAEACLLGGALMLYGIGRRGWRREVGLVAALLYLLSPISLRFGTALYPEPIVAAGMLASAYLFWLARDRDSAWLGVASAAAWWAAFEVKESAVWLLAFYAVLCVADLRKARAERAWAGMLGAGTAGLGIFLAAYWAATGDPLYRLLGCESHSLHSWYTYQGAPLAVYLDRLTLGPFREMALHKPYLLVGPWALWGVLSGLRRGGAGRSTVFWGGILGALLAWWWFGSTSFRFYNPIHLSVRHVFPVFPLVCLFAAAGLCRARYRWLPWFWVGITIMGALAGWVTGYCGGRFFYGR